MNRIHTDACGTEEEITVKTAEELAESWDEGVFEYQGYHFEAVGVLPEGIEGKVPFQIF